MDWWSELSDWIDIRDKSFPNCDFDYEPEINYSNFVVTNWERDLNEQACDQAQGILLEGEDTNLLNLEKDVIAIENQLVLTNISRSEFTDSVTLSERVKSIDLSIISLENTDTDAHISHESLMLQKELFERWDKVLKLLPEKYLPKNARQDNNKFITKELVLSSRQSETSQITGKKNVICCTETERIKDEVKEVTKSNIEELVEADINEINIVVKNDFILSMPETMKKEGEQEETKQHKCTKMGDVGTDAPVRITDEPKKLKKTNKFDFSTNGKSQLVHVKSSSGERSSFKVWTPSWNPTGNRNCPGSMKPATDLTINDIKHESKVNNELRKMSSNRGTKSSKKLKVAGQNSETVLSDLCRKRKETGKDVSKSTKRYSFSEAEMNKSDTLLEYYNNKREQFFQMNSKDRDSKKAKFRQSNQKEIKILKQKVKVLYELIGPKNEDFGVKSVCSNNTRAEIPSAQSVIMELQGLKLNLKVSDLKDIAEDIQLEKYRKFNKSKLIDEIILKITSIESKFNSSVVMV